MTKVELTEASDTGEEHDIDKRHKMQIETEEDAMNLTKSVIMDNKTSGAAQETARSDFRGVHLGNEVELRTYQGDHAKLARLDQHNKQSSATQLLFPPIQNIAAAEAAAFKSTLQAEAI